MKKKQKKFFIILLFILAALIRLYNFDYPIANLEIHVQYLVSSHIAKLWELPLIGYFNGTFPSLGATPIYNYILAIPIFFYDSLMFVNFINLSLQILSIYILFKLAKGLFGENVAIVSLIFITFSSVLITQAEWMWQPHLMFFFITLSFYLLYLFYKEKSIKSLFLSNLFFVLSLSTHMSSITLIPIYFVSVYLIHKSGKTRLKVPISSFLFTTAGTFLLYLPLFFHHQRFDTKAAISVNEKLVATFGQFPSNFLTKLDTFQNSVGILSLLSIILLSLLFYYFVYSKQKSDKKIVSLLLFLAVLSPIVAASFYGEVFLPQHFTAIYGLFFILVSVLLTSFSKIHYLSKTLSLLLIILLLVGFSGEFEKLKEKTIFHDLKVHKDMVALISKTVEGVHKNSFQFRLYTSNSVEKAPDDIWFFDTLFWPSLEKRFDMPFTKIIEEADRYWYKVINSDKNIIVGCFGYTKPEIVCIEEFSEEHEDYSIKKELFKNERGYSFFLAEKGM